MAYRREPVSYKGIVTDARTRDMLVELDRLTPDIPVVFTQGSYSTTESKSAGTHAGGGAVDISIRGLSQEQVDHLVWLGRYIGFADWERTAEQGFTPHLHFIARDCPDLSPAARAQVVQYLAGRNGLANRGPDDGPRVSYSNTWETYPQHPLSPPTNDQGDLSMADIVQILARLDRIDQRLANLAVNVADDQRNSNDGAVQAKQVLAELRAFVAREGVQDQQLLAAVDKLASTVEPAPTS